MSSGLSIANNLLANSIQPYLDDNQRMLQKAVNELSTGLRILTAADDPSGLAIATNLQTQSDAFQVAGRNLQAAFNCCQVALGSMTTQLDILRRIRSMAIEASSDLASISDRIQLQAEVSQLLLEIDRISENTTFNGQQLLDGSHAGFQSAVDAYLTVTANSALATNANRGSGVNGINYGYLVACAVASTKTFNTTPNFAHPGVQGLGGQSTVDGTIILQVVNTGVSIAVQETFVQSSNGLFCISPTLFGPSALAAGARNIGGTGTGSANGFDNVKITLGTITTTDEGSTAYIKVSQHVAGSTNPNFPAFSFQSGADEGDIVQLGIQATNTRTLRVQGISLVSTGINLTITPSAYQSYQSEDAIGQADIGINTLIAQQTNVGAVLNRLQYDQDNDNTAATNLQAAESNVRDANVGKVTTQFTKAQVLQSVGTSVLAQANAIAGYVLALFR